MLLLGRDRQPIGRIELLYATECFQLPAGALVSGCGGFRHIGNRIVKTLRARDSESGKRCVKEERERVFLGAGSTDETHRLIGRERQLDADQHPARPSELRVGIACGSARAQGKNVRHVSRSTCQGNGARKSAPIDPVQMAQTGSSI